MKIRKEKGKQKQKKRIEKPTSNRNSVENLERIFNKLMVIKEEEERTDSKMIETLKDENRKLLEILRFLKEKNESQFLPNRN